jgi:predicted nucleotidyltransferase
MSNAQNAKLAREYPMAAQNRVDAETRSAVRVFVKRIARQYNVERIILFGSRARRDHHADSDADVAVVLRGAAQPFLETKLAFADIAYDVLLEKDVLIQPFPIWEDEWEHPERYINPDLLQNISRDGIRL